MLPIHLARTGLSLVLWIAIVGAAASRARAQCSASAPSPGEISITARSAALGDPIAFGSSRGYFVYYRDPNPAFCPSGGTFNVGNAIDVVW